MALGNERADNAASDESSAAGDEINRGLKRATRRPETAIAFPRVCDADADNEANAETDGCPDGGVSHAMAARVAGEITLYSEYGFFGCGGCIDSYVLRSGTRKETVDGTLFQRKTDVIAGMKLGSRFLPIVTRLGGWDGNRDE